MICETCGSEGICPCRKHQGVGTCLTELIPDAFKILVRDDCNCKLEARQLNNLGPDECEKRFDEIATHIANKAPRLLLPVSKPMVGRWLKQAIKEARKDSKKSKRPELPNDSCLITGTDLRYVKGAYLLAWTFLKHNNGKMIVYLHEDVPANEPHVQQMRSWGVKTKAMPRAVRNNIPYHQAWRKPFEILKALDTYQRVLWLDADTAVSGSIHQAFNLLNKKPFVANHGAYGAENRNGKEVHKLFGPPKREWTIETYPCAGVAGFERTRDFDLVQEWSLRCQYVVERTDLWDPNMYSVDCPLKYCDQGILQDLLIEDTVNGNAWNDFSVRRKGSCRIILNELKSKRTRKIAHYAGKIKPFLYWDEVLDWDSPNTLLENSHA